MPQRKTKTATSANKNTKTVKVVTSPKKATPKEKKTAYKNTATNNTHKVTKVTFNTEDIMANTKFQFDQFTESATEINEAVTQSSTIAAKGIENIMKTCFDLMQQNSERQAGIMKKFMECRNVNDFTDLQTKLAQQNFDEFVSNATKISEMGVKCATDSFNPINDQINKAIKKATNKAAA